MKKKLLNFNRYRFLIGTTLVLVGLLPILILIVISTANLNKYLTIIEEETLRSDLLQVNNILEAELNDLEALSSDYAIWDDTYYGLINSDYDFYVDNFEEWLPENFDIDLIVVSSYTNKALGLYAVENKDHEDFLRTIDVTASKDEGITRKGLVKYNNTLYLYSYSPILKSDFGGISNGVVVLGREMSEPFLEAIKKTYGYDIFLSFDDQLVTNFKSDFNEKKILMENNLNEELFLMGDQFSYVKENINCINEGNAAILGLKKSRGFYLGILELFYENGSTTIILSLCMFMLLSLYLSQKLVSPILTFEKAITKMTLNERITEIKHPKIFELKQLAIAFNNMAGKLFNEEHQNKLLREVNNKDGLTKLYNHRYFHEYVAELIKHKTKICLMFCDIDKFKAVNDTFGHSIGDKVLQDLSDGLKSVIRETGEVFRYGGEEFVVVLKDINHVEAFELAEKLRNHIDVNITISEEYHYVPLTMSIGYAFYPEDAHTIQDLVDKADSAMYYAKQNGRNQCYKYHESMEEFLLKNSEIFAREEVLVNSAFALAAAIDTKDVYTGKHSELVTKYAMSLGSKIGICEKEKQLLRIGALLHDCGKIGIPDEIINKSSALSDEEYEIIKNHTVFGHNIVRHIAKTPSIMSCVRNHHERWDGKGYPDQLKGDEIPIFARIVCLVDTYHAMISDRPYRKALSIHHAVSKLRQNAGIQFDPNLVEKFIETLIESGEFNLYDAEFIPELTSENSNRFY